MLSKSETQYIEEQQCLLFHNKTIKFNVSPKPQENDLTAKIFPF